MIFAYPTAEDQGQMGGGKHKLLGCKKSLGDQYKHHWPCQREDLFWKYHIFNGMLQAFCLETCFSSHGIHPGIRVRIFTAGYPSGVPHIESEDFKSHVSLSFQYECPVSFSSRVFPLCLPQRYWRWKRIRWRLRRAKNVLKWWFGTLELPLWYLNIWTREILLFSMGIFSNSKNLLTRFV